MEGPLSSYFTLDQRIEFHQKCLQEREQQLQADMTDEARKAVEGYRNKEKEALDFLFNRKETLLTDPRYLFLIASESDCKVFQTISTYIETPEEAKHFAESIMRKMIEVKNVMLEIGTYRGLIVRKSYYDKEADKVDFRKFQNNRYVYIISKQIVVTDKGLYIA